METILLTPENIDEYGFFCIKDLKSEGFNSKKEWFVDNYKQGLKIFS